MGRRYIRGSRVIRSATVRQVRTAGGFRPVMDSDILLLVGDLVLDVPAGAKAVYVGTAVFQHDGKKATAILVRDEHAAAMGDLAAQKIPVLTPKNVVKRLARPVTATAQAR